jgi:lipopolysaccharide/colanic/teichoic acid biosynthesis glycosyltransferase
MSVSSPAERKPVQWALKRAVDVAAATAGLAVLAPGLLLLGAAIRLESPGGALFRQERVGRAGTLFSIVKFRTMRAGAPVQFNADGSTRVVDGDPRVTRLGRFLRGGIDELPQLLNVLRGDMSLVGPRPDMRVHADLYTDDERGKLVVRPGMTSLPAVLGRNEIPWRTRMVIDLRYVERWSFALDAKVIVQTLLMPFGIRPFRFREIVGDLL